MLGNIIKKEILDNLLSHKFLFIFIMCSVLILFSVYIGASDYAESKKEYDTNVSALRDRMQPPETISIFSGEYEGFRIFRPPQVLRTIVAGVEDAAGRVSYPNLLYENNLKESRHEGNTIFSLFGSLDLMFAVKFILSLCALFITYEVISAEKEKGTLKLTLSNSVSRHQLISGKIIGNYLSLLLLFLVPLLMGLIMLLLFPGISLNGEDWFRLVFILIMFLLYISVFFALGIFVSAVTTRAATSFLVLLFLWIALVIVVPGAAVVVAEQIRPIPSSSSVESSKSLAWIEASSAVNEEYSSKMNELISRYSQRMIPIQPLRQTDPARFQEEMQKIQKELNLQEEQSKIAEWRMQEITDRVTTNNVQLERDYELKKGAQQSLAKNISRISPASSLTFGTMTLARTGVDEYGRFLVATRTFRPVYRKWMGALTSNATSSEINDSIVASIPQFPFVPEKPVELLARTLPDFALMAVMTIILLTGAFFAFLRYDVR